mgnify:CR=1 FL=1
MELKKELLPYIPLAQMLVQTLGPDCEVVLHDLDNPAHSVVYVENPSVTGRKVGESFDIKDADGHLTGALCINLDTKKITQSLAFLQSLLPPGPQKAAPAQAPSDAGAHVSVMIENLMDNILKGADIQNLSRDERLEKVRFMDEKGLFLMKGSVEKAAEKLGVGKVTIYSYLDEVRGKRG